MQLPQVVLWSLLLLPVSPAVDQHQRATRVARGRVIMEEEEGEEEEEEGEGEEEKGNHQVELVLLQVSGVHLLCPSNAQHTTHRYLPDMS